MAITLDTGALTDLAPRGGRDRRPKSRLAKIIHTATTDGLVITVPAPVIAEWWRESSRRADEILAMFTVEELTTRIAKLAGVALAEVEGATAIDAIVMASASLRGDVVYTSDLDDLVRLRDGHFPNVRVLRVS